MIKSVKNQSRYANRDVSRLVEYCTELKEVEAWNVIFDDEPKTWDRLCREIIETDLDLSAIETGYLALKKDDYKGPVSSQLAITTAREKPALAEHGEIGRGRDRGRDSTSNGKRDNSYLARRLLRDAPEIFDALEKGDYTSVRQAAIAAGIVKEPTPYEVAERAVKKLTREERQTLREYLNELDV